MLLMYFVVTPLCFSESQSVISLPDTSCPALLWQTDPDGETLPQINAALFLSPGGRKFKDLLLALTQFVLIKSLQKLGEAAVGMGKLLGGDICVVETCDSRGTVS